jgi:two-component system, cell cycle sensor histidine kinase DivJ
MHVHGRSSCRLHRSPTQNRSYSPTVTTPTPPPAEPRDEAKARFLAELSHELRTPISAIMGFSDAMRDRAFGPLSDTYVEHAHLIHAAGRHLLDLVDDLADLAAMEAGRREITLEAFDAASVVAETVRLMAGEASRSGVELAANLPGGPLMVMAGRRQMRQIILNLVANALRFTPAGGSVTVAARVDQGELALSVSDTGAGIEAKDLGRLGKPFVRADAAEHQAPGLGLWLVRSLSEAHGGSMAIESTPGAGTTASVRLPVAILGST